MKNRFFASVMVAASIVVLSVSNALATTGWDPTTGMEVDMTAPKALAVLFIGTGAVVMYAIRKATKTSNRV